MGLRDPARALRLAVRSGDDAKVAALVDWLLRTVPLIWPGEDKAPLISVSIIRGAVDASSDGFAFRVDEATGIVRAIRRQDEVPQLSVGDRIVRLNESTLLDQSVRLREAVPPESLAVLGVWKRGAMAAVRARLARDCINDAFLEVAQSTHANEATLCRIAERLLRARASVQQADESGMTALHWASYLGKAELTDLLLSRGAPLDGLGGAAASAASGAASGSASARAGSARHVGRTPLQLGVIGGHTAVVRQLLLARADPFAPAADGRQLIHLAALGPCEELVELLLDPTPDAGGRQKLDALSGHGWSALFLATADDNLGMVKALLALGAPLGQVLRGRPLLHHAAACGASATVRWLGTECAAQLPVDGRDAKGRTPLLLAARHSRLGAVEALISLGASPAIDAHAALDDPAVAEDVRLMLGAAMRQWRRSRSSLLLLAAAAGDVQAMRALHLEQGADLLHADSRGYTALHHAAAGGHEDATLYLLQTDQAGSLATASTRDFGVRADWRPLDLAATARVRTVLADFVSGSADSRSRVLEYARRRLAQHVAAAAEGQEGEVAQAPPDERTTAQTTAAEIT